MITICTVNYKGREYRISHSIHRRLNDAGKLENYHFIEVFHGGHLCRVRVSGFDSQYPQITKLADGCGWLHLCEVLTDWPELKPDNFLCWC